MAAYPPVGRSVPSSRVELHISCKDLRKADALSKSDPLTAVYTLSPTKAWTEYARTELIKNNQNPQFTKAIEIEYRFEELQKLKFTIYDLDNATVSLGDDDFLGEIECSLGEIVSTGSYTKPLCGKGGKKGQGTITIRAEEISQKQQMVELSFSGKGLDKKDFLGKSDPYLEFERGNPDGSFTSVYKNDYIKNTLDPHWPPFTVNSQTLCSSDSQRPIRVKCFDWDADSSHDLIGQFTTTLAELTADGSANLSWPLINPSKQAKKKKYNNSGTIVLNSIKITPCYSFLDYIFGGCQINFTVGVDFTGSNGDPASPSSLHYIDPARPNEYTQALLTVGSICQDYDTDKLFPAFGFGGKIGDAVSHEFALNGNPQNPYCMGIHGVIQAYHQALRSVKLWGPTNAAPIINHVASFAQTAAQDPNNQQYFVLLMITDGALSDMQQTKCALINASRLPMSVILVGVGGADFSAMNELDSDDKLLRVAGLVAERDIVQFVPFRQFAAASPEAMAAVVLAEIPGQLTEYMKKRGIEPRGRPQ